ncbi:MAG: helix-turn-helix domain-containing protein [Pontixanthobacter sp.]
MILGERLVERMKAAGLSQAALARRVGVSQPSIFKLIHENKTGSGKIHVIARELETTPAYLMGETDNPETEIPEFALNGKEREWIEIFRMLEHDDAIAMMDMAKRLIRKDAPPVLNDTRAEYGSS